MKSITLLTDIPVWVRPLAQLLESKGALVQVATSADEIRAEGLVVNRISTRVMRREKERARRFAEALRILEKSGRPVVNGAQCFELGCSKLAQAELFQASGARTPLTVPAVTGGRALPGKPVLLKPPAGGFGKGIQKLESNEPAPPDLFTDNDGWVEQEIVSAADGCVHRIEILGDQILYEATSPLRAGEFNYCLADPDSETILHSAEDISAKIKKSVLKISRQSGMKLGAVEYLLDEGGEPFFIDLNPVSSLHPGASEILGEDPLAMTATYLIQQTTA